MPCPHEENAHFAVIPKTSDNPQGQDEVLSVATDADVVYLSVDGSRTNAWGANFELHGIGDVRTEREK